MALALCCDGRREKILTLKTGGRFYLASIDKVKLYIMHETTKNHSPHLTMTKPKKSKKTKADRLDDVNNQISSDSPRQSDGGNRIMSELGDLFGIESG